MRILNNFQLIFIALFCSSSTGRTLEQQKSFDPKLDQVNAEIVNADWKINVPFSKKYELIHAELQEKKSVVAVLIAGSENYDQGPVGKSQLWEKRNVFGWKAKLYSSLINGRKAVQAIYFKREAEEISVVKVAIFLENPKVNHAALKNTIEIVNYILTGNRSADKVLSMANGMISLGQNKGGIVFDPAAM